MLAQEEYELKKQFDQERVDSQRGKPKVLFKHVEWYKRKSDKEKNKEIIKQSMMECRSSSPKQIADTFIPFI